MWGVGVGGLPKARYRTILQELEVNGSKKKGQECKRLQVRDCKEEQRKIKPERAKQNVE